MSPNKRKQNTHMVSILLSTSTNLWPKVIYSIYSTVDHRKVSLKINEFHCHIFINALEYTCLGMLFQKCLCKYCLC
ncbi:hypothetical protein PRUPE_6G152100 [Prunus persica]|uniref:Uncharacterized protein n=1 Tax=Prunus persica TaxID=3760 RepID=A0A251NQS8_PRUPE|nr:hypothetical protein PRUPE_6G152100 [Prunus persica]